VPEVTDAHGVCISTPTFPPVFVTKSKALNETEVRVQSNGNLKVNSWRDQAEFRGAIKPKR
jgi:hypothetical protein